MKTSANLSPLRVLVAVADSSHKEQLRCAFGHEGWDAPHEVADVTTAQHWLNTTAWDWVLLDCAFFQSAGAELIAPAFERNPNLTVVTLQHTEGDLSGAATLPLLRQGVFDTLPASLDLESLTLRLRKAHEQSQQLSKIGVTRHVIDALVVALESKDRFVQGHSQRVTEYSLRLGGLLGLDARELEILDWSARLHDVGKVGVHEEILNKPGPLTADEFEVMKRHPVLSRDIVRSIEYLAPCLPVIYHHHERIDGRGYPAGIGGDEIPLLSRVISLADSYDAMSSERAHRPALAEDRVDEILREVAGSQLDADLVDLFLKNKPLVVDLSEEAAKKCWTSRA